MSFMGTVTPYTPDTGYTPYTARFQLSAGIGARVRHRQRASTARTRWLGSEPKVSSRDEDRVECAGALGVKGEDQERRTRTVGMILRRGKATIKGVNRHKLFVCSVLQYPDSGYDCARKPALTRRIFL